MSQSVDTPVLAKPITSFTINALAFVFSCIVLAFTYQQYSTLLVTVFVSLAYGLPVILLEAIFLKVYAKSSTGLDFSKKLKRLDYKTPAIKLIGLYFTLASVAGFYTLFPEYHGDFYTPYYQVLTAILPYWLLLAVPYFILVNHFMREPKDGYWYLGILLVGRKGQADLAYVVQHYLGWLVKAFFLPLMFIYLIGKINYFQGYSWHTLFDNMTSFQHVFDFTYASLFYIDLLVVTVGYACTLRIFDAHIRSSEYSFLGWGVALMCYQPLWSKINSQYINYDDGNGWGYWFWQNDIMYGVWGCLILALIAIYVWATMMFGIRFSNLTNRGIITHGIYRFTKHPAYVSKNLSWWLISMPFLTNSDWYVSVRMCVLLLLLNFIYFMRARTEERHLSYDPDYVAYAEYMERHGMFRKLGQWLPFLRFKPKQLFNTELQLKPLIKPR